MSNVRLLPFAGVSASILGNKLQLQRLVPWFVWTGYLPVLAVLPLWFHTAGSTASPAHAEGYSNGAAFLGVVLWSAVAVIAGWWASQGSSAKVLTTVQHRRAVPAKWPLLAIPLAVIMLYFPPILARAGPFFEDNVFLTALQRMQFGDRPYEHFEFLYGPLMIYLPYYWTRLFGYSLIALYSYTALLEAAYFLALYSFLRKVVTNGRRLWAAFSVMAALTFNILIGPNQNGFRKLLPAVVLTMAAWNPESILRSIACGAFMGVQLAYSHDYGIAGTGGTVAIYALTSLNRRNSRPLLAGLTFCIASAAVWFAVAYATVGSTFPAYIRESRELTRLFSSGAAAFRFVWTANSLALFGLLAIGCVATGVCLRAARSEELRRGDLLLCGATVFALIALKSGLNRCDLWHLQPAFLPLVFAAFIAWPSKWLDGGILRWRTAQLLAIVAAATSLVGLIPSARYVASGWVNGAAALLSGAPNPVVESRSPSILNEQGPARRDPALIALAGYLARHPESPVYYYANTSGLGPFTGVPKRDPINDDYLYSDKKGLLARAWLSRHPGAVVVVFRDLYDRLLGVSPAPLTGFEEWRPSRSKRLIGLLASAHWRSATLDDAQKEQRFARSVGEYVRSSYELDREFGPILTLRNRRPVN